MYKATVRALMRHSVTQLNRGDYSMMLKLAHPDFTLAFPGENSWATMFRPTVKGRDRHVTHQGVQEAAAFAERVVSQGTQFRIEDILVNGGPWQTRVALRVHVFIPSAGGGDDAYNNRAVLLLEIRWGRLVAWETYEDTQRVAAWDAHSTPATMSLGRAGPGVETL